MTNSDATDSRHAISIDEALAGLRLDKALSVSVPEWPRTQAKRLITQGDVSIDGDVVRDPAIKVKVGQAITLAASHSDTEGHASTPEREDEPEPEAMALDIRYEDEDLLVINKPAGLVVHPGAGHSGGTLVNGLLHHCGGQLSTTGGAARAGIVHRLDKDTSGLMLVAKNNHVHERLSRALRQRRITRRYEAFVLGTPLPPVATIDTPFARHPRQRTKYHIPREADEMTRRAITHYKQLSASPCGTIAHIQCHLETGRTHQIRVHMAYKATPVLGDPVYGPGRPALASALQKSKLDEESVQHILNLDRQALHASQLSFDHPTQKTEMCFESGLPDDLAQLIW